jgi:hypothetical protein
LRNHFLNLGKGFETLGTAFCSILYSTQCWQTPLKPLEVISQY